MNTEFKGLFYSLIILTIQVLAYASLVDNGELSNKSYVFWFMINLTISVVLLNLEQKEEAGLIKSNKPPLDSRAINIGFYFSLLVLGAWFVYAEFAFFESSLNKLTGLAVILFFVGLVGIASKGYWPFGSDEGMLFAQKHKYLVLAGNLLILVSIICGLVLMVFTPFVWRGYVPW